MPTVQRLPHQPFLDGAVSAGFRWRLGLRPLDPAEWFDGGPDAVGWIAEKQLILDAHHDTAFAVLDGVDDEALEVATAVETHLGMHRPEDLHPLEGASRLVAEDLVLMVERDGRLVFGGGSVCFPNRWDLRSKLGLTLAEVHAPVPRLNDQLEEPVDRFLSRLGPERGYWRLGWGVIDVADGYTPVDGTGPVRPERVDPPDLFVRVERETLRRFPATRCVLFTIRTYVARLGEVAADEEARRAIADRVDVMPDEVRRYKDVREVGDALVEFLRRPAQLWIDPDTI